MKLSVVMKSYGRTSRYIVDLKAISITMVGETMIVGVNNIEKNRTKNTALWDTLSKGGVKDQGQQ